MVINRKHVNQGIKMENRDDEMGLGENIGPVVEKVDKPAGTQAAVAAKSTASHERVLGRLIDTSMRDAVVQEARDALKGGRITATAIRWSVDRANARIILERPFILKA